LFCGVWALRNAGINILSNKFFHIVLFGQQNAGLMTSGKPSHAVCWNATTEVHEMMERMAVAPEHFWANC
jgi:hypothetical protein